MRNFSPAKKRVDVSPGESVRIIRELQGLSQTQLAGLCGIPQTTISSIENSRVNLGVERAKVLALALRCPRSDICKGAENGIVRGPEAAAKLQQLPDSLSRDLCTM